MAAALHHTTMTVFKLPTDVDQWPVHEMYFQDLYCN